MVDDKPSRSGRRSRSKTRERDRSRERSRSRDRRSRRDSRSDRSEDRGRSKTPEWTKAGKKGKHREQPKQQINRQTTGVPRTHKELQQYRARRLQEGAKNVRTTTTGRPIRVPMFKEPLFRNKPVKTVINPNTVSGASTPKKPVSVTPAGNTKPNTGSGSKPLYAAVASASDGLFIIVAGKLSYTNVHDFPL